MADDDEQRVREFMIQNKLAQFADAVAVDGYLLDDLATMSPTELQELVDDVNMRARGTLVQAEALSFAAGMEFVDGCHNLGFNMSIKSVTFSNRPQAAANIANRNPRWLAQPEGI